MAIQTHMAQPAATCPTPVWVHILQGANVVSPGATLYVPFESGKTADYDRKNALNLAGCPIVDLDHEWDASGSEPFYDTSHPRIKPGPSGPVMLGPTDPDDPSQFSPAGTYWSYSHSGIITAPTSITATCYWYDDDYVYDLEENLLDEEDTNDTPDFPSTDYAQQVTIVVVSVESVDLVSGATSQNVTGNSTWAGVKDTSTPTQYVVVEADIEPNVAPEDLPANFLSWSGGEAVSAAWLDEDPDSGSSTRELYDLDAPGCSTVIPGSAIYHTSEVYANYKQYVTVTLDTERQCSDNKLWIYISRVDVDKPTNQVDLNVLSSLSHITIPTTPHYTKR